MKTYQVKDLRNVAIVGGAGAGKSTLAEALAFESKLIDRMFRMKPGARSSRQASCWSKIKKAAMS